MSCSTFANASSKFEEVEAVQSTIVCDNGLNKFEMSRVFFANSMLFMKCLTKRRKRFTHFCLNAETRVKHADDLRLKRCKEVESEREAREGKQNFLNQHLADSCLTCGGIPQI